MQIDNGFLGIPYAYWFSKIKLRTNQRIVSKDLLKDVFMREICCNESKGGNTKGIPKRYMWAIINDMKFMSFQAKKVPFKPLVARLNHSSQSGYEISTCQEYKKVLAEPFPF